MLIIHIKVHHPNGKEHSTSIELVDLEGSNVHEQRKTKDEIECKQPIYLVSPQSRRILLAELYVVEYHPNHDDADAYEAEDFECEEGWRLHG